MYRFKKFLIGIEWYEKVSQLYSFCYKSYKMFKSLRKFVIL